MRITLIHNPSAGGGQHHKKDLLAALTQAGHRTTYQSTEKSGYKKALKKPTDLVLIAGGDGTMRKVASQLIDSGIPIAILPLGTANNVARSLGFVASPEEVMAKLEYGKKRRFDVGVARGPWGKRYFFEGAGAGLLADYVQRAKKKANEKKNAKRISKEQEMARHILRLRRMLNDYPAQKWKIELDGKNISGSYILWEAMNVRSIGPALYLAPRAAIKDGRFDFVCVRVDDRTLLMKYFDARLSGKKSNLPLPMRRFRKLKVLWGGSTIHFDDEIWPNKKEKPKRPAKIKIAVKSSALIVLQPAEDGVNKNTKRAFPPRRVRRDGKDAIVQ